ncbi:hypothetical protein [Ramlibacter rhizophilus]|uniref:Uncharacterized protein n=1 Tax=Ramlibacter rhizophilus TaxID=1781167 RepID=A0A4Z0BGY3_9BURK|nr:hypothetical protein [Ramlibacter rhizophilus]TFY98552.1 hypothetical protein EZ242_13510 [Ramlibacter rhizophilus]
MSAGRLALFGTDEPIEPALTLQAGPLTVRVRGTRIVSIHAQGHEVWHGVAFLYRDSDWGTPEPVVEHIQHHANAQGFQVQVRACVPVQPPIELRITIDGDAAGRIRYEGVATPHGDIATNRTGLCLLHPQSLAGQRIEVLHDDGRTSTSTFPRRVAPWPPFMSVRGIGHAFGTGGWAQARFEGDVFEFEDQRNNADASFKTYNRSNLMPRPYRLRGGQDLRQSVELVLVQASATPARAPAAITVASEPATPARPGMRVGIAISPADAQAGDPVLAALSRMRPAHLHLELPQASHPVDWPGVAGLVAAAGAALRVDVLDIREQSAWADLQALSAAVTAAGLRPEAVAVFPSTPPVVQAARASFPTSTVGGGTPWFFTQLNRAEDLGPVDFLSFTTSALVHGADDESVMAGLRSLPAMLETLAQRYPGVPVRVGPSGIATRRSPLGARPPSDGTRRIALAARDPRTRALFGAAWMVGFLAALAEAGAQAATVMNLSDLASQDVAACTVPAATLVMELLRPSVHAVAVNDPSRAAAVVSGESLLLANITDDPITVSSSGRQGLRRCLDARGGQDDSGSPWRLLPPGEPATLPPFALATILSAS